jgi:restriction endonuclease S subunit
MSEYQLFTLGQICSLIKDGTHGTHPRQKDGIPLISAKDVQDGRITISSDTSRISREEYEAIHRSYEIKEGDLLISLVGSIGRCALVTRNHGTFSAQRSVGILRSDSSKVDPKYLYHATCDVQFQKQLLSRSKSTAQAGVYLGELAQCSISLPPLPEQKKIAEILSGIDLRINSLKKQKQKLVNIYKACSGELFSAVSNRVPLGDVCDLQVGFPFRSADFREDGIRLLRGENVGYGKPEWSRAQFLPRALSQSCSQYNLEAGDIVVGMDRSFTKTGFKVSSISSRDLPCLLVQRVGRFIPKRITRNYLWHILQSVEYQKTLSASEKGMDIPHLSKSEILEPVVPLADDERQEQISITLDSLMHSLTAIACSIESTTQLSLALRSDLLSGRKRVKI